MNDSESSIEDDLLEDDQDVEESDQDSVQESQGSHYD